MLDARFDKFVALVCELPQETWLAALAAEPEWKWMQPLSEAWKFGPFASLFIVLGLNDYQTKGKADVGYWPKVVPPILHAPELREPSQLINLLEPFFSRERLAEPKIERLKRFANSDLCHKIWKQDSASIAADFKQIWVSLASTMRQKQSKKTIAFAMKCLALALLMVEQGGFDFASVPVPVDSRIRSISARLGCRQETDSGERERWDGVLQRIRQRKREVTMVHLDSLLWQIGTLSQSAMQSHLLHLNAANLAQEISLLFPGAAEVSESPATCRT